jgi:cell filamentation protein, protein adenylyltransferase
MVTGGAILGLPVTLFFLTWQRGVMPRKPERPHMHPRLTERITRKKTLLDSYRPLPADTVRRLNEDLRVFLTYHSNAIEGNTLSLQETQMVIDYGMTIHGHPLREYLEAINHAEAYQYITKLIEQQEMISVHTILTLHSLVTDKILESKGRFRTVPVYIRGSNMTPPPAHQVEGLMHEWITWIYGEGQEYEPIARTTIAHHGFEAIHGFEDGNGRVGRLLLNLMLMQEGYPPALLLNDWRVRYIHGLNVANTGQYGPLLNLIGQSAEAGLDLYLEACSVAPDNYQPLRELVEISGYPPGYLSWLARQGRIDAIKRNGHWYSTREAIEQYKVEASKQKRPPARQ